MTPGAVPSSVKRSRFSVMVRASISTLGADQPTSFTSPPAKQCTSWRNPRRGFAEKANCGSSNSGANYDTVLPAAGEPQEVARPRFPGGEDIKTFLFPSLLLLTCYATNIGLPPMIIVGRVANALDFPSRPCCMRGLRLSRTIRALLPPHRPHPREIGNLSQRQRVSPAQPHHLPALQNHTSFANANIISKFFHL